MKQHRLLSTVVWTLFLPVVGLAQASPSPSGHPCRPEGDPPNICAVWNAEKCAWEGEVYPDACGVKHCEEPDPLNTECCRSPSSGNDDGQVKAGTPFNPEVNICCGGELIPKGPLLRSTPTVEVGLFGVTSAANGILNSIEGLANGAVASVNIDTGGVRELVLSFAEGKGWTSEFVAQIVVDVIAKAEANLNAAKNSAAADLINSAKRSISGGISKLEPKAKFQADVSYYEGCCKQAQWSGVAVNKLGISSVSGFGEFQYKFRVAASAVAEVGVDFLLKIKIEGSFAVSGFNPVRPTSGSGESFTITATPNIERKLSVSAGGGVLLQVTLGGTISDNDTLGDVSGTLVCPGGSQ